MTNRLGILISGGGTTMEEIIKATTSEDIPDTEVACVIASSENAGGITKALRLGIREDAIVILKSKDFRNSEGEIDREAFGKAMLKFLEKHNASVVTQNGWIPLTPNNVIEAFPKSIFNQHPGPPEQFGGKGMRGRAVHAAVLEFQKRVGRIFPTAVVAHYVEKGLDEGSVVKHESVPVLPGDTAETLQKRALPAEHRVQIGMLNDYVRGEIQICTPEIHIAKDELSILEQAKQIAVTQYPKG